MVTCKLTSVSCSPLLRSLHLLKVKKRQDSLSLYSNAQSKWPQNLQEVSKPTPLGCTIICLSLSQSVRNPWSSAKLCTVQSGSMPFSSNVRSSGVWDGILLMLLMTPITKSALTCCPSTWVNMQMKSRTPTMMPMLLFHGKLLST